MGLRTLSEGTVHSASGNLAGRLVYYDLSGQRYEPTPASSLIDEALKLFGHKAKAVRRSSGGLAIAEPYQLVVYGDPTTQSTDSQSLRVRVKFRDFRRDGKGRVVAAEYISHRKTVLPEELREAFSFQTASLARQRFVLDFGDGTIPVQVFHFEESHNVTYAYFIEPAQALRVQKVKRGSVAPITVYRVERDVLRFASLDVNGEAREWEEACRNYQRLVAIGAPAIPSCLRTGGPVKIPGGLMPNETAKKLREVISGKPDLVVVTKGKAADGVTGIIEMSPGDTIIEGRSNDLLPGEPTGIIEISPGDTAIEGRSQDYQREVTGVIEMSPNDTIIEASAPVFVLSEDEEELKPFAQE